MIEILRVLRDWLVEYIINPYPGVILLLIALSWAYWWSPTLRVPIHFLLRALVSEPAKFVARWAFWAGRISLLAAWRVGKNLVLPRSIVCPEIGNPNEPGAVRPGWRPLRLGGAADTWSLSGAVVAAFLRFTPAWRVVYPAAWLSSDTALTLLNIGESVLIAWGIVWLGLRVWLNRPLHPALPTRLLIRSSDGLNSKEAFRIGRRIDTGAPVYLPAALLPYNTLGYGSPGSGKTSIAKLLMEQQIERGGGLIFIDAKLDAADVKQVFSFARSAGREHDVLFINPGNPDESNTYNPILDGDEDEIADRCLALIPAAERAGEDHYREAARRAIKTTVAALRVSGLAYSFRDLSTILGSGEAMEAFCEILRERAPTAPATADFLFLLDQYRLPGNRGYNIKLLQETYGGIAGRLGTFGTGAFGAVTSAYNPEVRLYEAIRAQKIIYVSLPSMAKAEASTSFAKIFVADLRTAIARVQAEPPDERALFLAFMDEMATYAMPAMNTIFSQNRSSRIALIPLTQTPAQLSEAVSENFTSTIETGCKTKLFFQLADAEACEHAAKIIGESSQSAKSLGMVNSRGANTSKSSASPDGSDAGGSSTTVTEREERGWRVPPENFAALDKGELILWSDGHELVHIQADRPPETPGDLQIEVQHPELPAVEGVEFYERFVLKRFSLAAIVAKALEAQDAASAPVSTPRKPPGGGTSLDLYRE
ncbi:type IV secretory system conjugative DNA transfer family protein [Castellaniella hirudinis]|uniref:Type IV secretory system conjugative DNA transfer family protein n=1 Tax=Castellaniella hirudinis TaxID=1144617 RepID=A0ABV8RVW5_9BURK